jgi:excinuclease UvrABC nuclease subunit
VGDDPQVVAAALETAMMEAADALKFEEAAMLRDELHALLATLGTGDPISEPPTR